METVNGSKNGASADGRRFVFGEFTVDPSNRVVLHGNDVVPVTAKVFDVLVVFVQNPGRLLTKDELIAEVWPGNFVEEGNLARNVSFLRNALGDTGRTHKYISTVQGKGYRFIAEVDETARAASDVSVKNGASVIAPVGLSMGDAGRRHRTIWMVAIGILILSGITLIASQIGFLPSQSANRPSFERVRQTKLTQDGNVFYSRISPDGQYLAYIGLSEEKQSLNVRQLSTGSVLTILPSAAGVKYYALAFGADNSFIYYIRKEPNAGTGSIFRMPLLGGPSRMLVGSAEGGLILSPDGSQMAFTRIDKAAGTALVYVANDDGSGERIAASAKLDSAHLGLCWSPDGKSLFYTFRQNGPDGDKWHLAEIPAAGGTERQIGETFNSRIMSFAWIPNRSGFVINAVDDDTREPQLYFMSYPDGAKWRITNDLNNYSNVSVTADGRSIVASQTNSGRQIWELSDDRSGAASQITSANEKHFEGIDWMRDEYLVFAQDENSSFDNFNIWRMRPDGGGLQQLTTGNGDNTEPTVSGDGEVVVFVSKRSGTPQLWRMNSLGGDVRRLMNFPGKTYHPRISSDGRSVYFKGYVDGRSGIWRVSVGGGEATRLIDADTNMFVISNDGNYLIYAASEKAGERVRTHVHRIDNSEPDRVVDIIPETWMQSAPDGQSIFYDTADDDVRNVWQQPLDGSPPRQMTSFHNEHIYQCAFSSTGVRSACIRHTISYDTVMIRLD